MDFEFIRAAREVLPAYLKKQGAYTEVPRSEALKSKAKIILLRCVDANKGDRETPNVRARLVEKELRTDDNRENFANTPPLEALRAGSAAQPLKVVNIMVL